MTLLSRLRSLHPLRGSALPVPAVRDPREDESARRRRAFLWARHPSAAWWAEHPERMWPLPAEGEEMLTVGIGAVPWGTADPADSLPAERLLDGVPRAVPLRGGLCVRGSPLVVEAALRALVLGVCASCPPEQWRICGALPAWAARLPHAVALDTGPGSGEERGNLGSVLAGAAFDPRERIRFCGPGDSADGARVVISWGPPGRDVPSGCETVLDVGAGMRGVLRRGDRRERILVEALAREQAEALAEEIRLRGRGRLLRAGAAAPGGEAPRGADPVHDAGFARPLRAPQPTTARMRPTSCPAPETVSGRSAVPRAS